MRVRLGLLLGAMLATMSLGGASTAAAATEVGNDCVANLPAPVVATALQLERAPGTSLPLSVPTNGVVTQWKVRSMDLGELFAWSHLLKVLRATGNPNEFRVVGESEIEPVRSGENAFDTRIPVQAGDRLGLYGFLLVAGSLICKTEDTADVVGFSEGNVPVGSAATMTKEGGYQMPVSAIVEPDADNDGYGDESQDGCPESGSIQAECPPLLLDTFPTRKKGKVVVLVAASTTAKVTVSGSAKLPKGSKKANGSAQAKLRKVTKTVTAGRLSRFVLRFSRKLKTTLAGLAPGRRLTLKLQARGTNTASRVSTDKASLKLKR